MSSSATTSTTCRELANQLNAAGLFAREDLRLLMASLGCDDSSPSDVLIQKLTSADRLTTFQARTIRDGRVHELVVGNYEILARLGAGGMGTVFKARHRRMKRIVALKVMSRQLCKDQTSVQRFQREVETIARLSHPNIVLAYDADEAEIGHFLVMEFVDGRDLASVVQQNGPLSIRDAISCTIQAAQGLEYAHSQSIIHRDIKPANLLRDPMGMVKITDLGLARLHEAAQPAADTGLTQAGCVVGTPDFMSPEQAMDSGTIDHRSDIYSLGCTLYYFLVGAPPYQGNSLMGTLLKHRDAPIPLLSSVRADTPVALEAAFRKMVAKNRDQRFQTMAEVATALMAVPLPQREATPPTSSPGAANPNLDNLEGNFNQNTVMFAPEAASTSNLQPTRAAPALLIALLVESSRAQASIIRKYLENLGLEAILATSRAEAISLATQHKPDVVLSAMYLKDGTGPQLAQQLNAQFPFNAPGFVLITSQEESQNVGSLSHCGLAVMLQKPFALDKLAETLSAIMKRPLQPVAGSATPLPIRSTGSTFELKRPPVDRSALHVLIVDDSAAARAIERQVLQSLGLKQIVEVMDGAQAVAAVAQQKFDLIFTDYNMPLMDGAALVGYLRQNSATAATPIVMVTTETDEAKLASVRKRGVTAICPKTFPIETVRPILAALFGQ